MSFLHFMLFSIFLADIRLGREITARQINENNVLFLDAEAIGALVGLMALRM